jgi:hypothetical protein
VSIKGDGVLLDLTNREPSTRYVVGDWGLGVSKTQQRRYLRPIQPYHRKFWQPAQEVVNENMQGFKEETQKILTDWFHNLLEGK